MSHLIADTPQELMDAESRLGIPEGSIQHAGTPKEHLDVSQSKRDLAIKRLNAKPITQKQMVYLIRQKRKGKSLDPDNPETL